MVKLYWFPSPNEYQSVMSIDLTSVVVKAVPATHPTGRVGWVFNLPDDTPFGPPDKTTGAEIVMVLDGWEDMRYRGILNKSADGLGYINIDDVKGVKKVICPEIPVPPNPPNPNPDPSRDPFTIIKAVYATGKYELVTKDGCGKFTEACCDELHKLHSNNWGYVRKFPPQNMYNGHGVDVVQLLVRTINTAADVYDIITDSESVDAKVAFNSKGPAVPDLWYYPA